MSAMQNLVSRLRLHWPVVSLLGSGALLAGAHAFQRLGGLAPCVLCLQQRDWHWGVVAASVAGFLILRFWPGGARWIAALLGVALLGAAGMGGYHVAVEQHWIAATCQSGGDLGAIESFDVNATFVAPTCDTPAWTLLGVSMAGYNALISLALALASFAVASTPERRHG
jgi:disulfide bond formation protein DsbB